MIAVATIGHHRHGKTRLTSAITEVLARRSRGRVKAMQVHVIDREPRWFTWRGDVHGDRSGSPAEGWLETRTVRAGEVRYETPRRRFVHIDSPGYRRWLKNAARAQALVDGLILVVSAPDGAQAQTHEQLLLARALGIGQLVVFITKCDRVRDPEWLDLVEHDVRVLLGRCGFDGDATRIVRGAGLPVCRGETGWETGIDDLVEALERKFEPPESAPAPAGPPLLYVDRVFGLSAGSVIVDGRIHRGTIRRGDTMALVGLGARTFVSVASIETDHQRIASARQGDLVGLHLMRVVGEFQRGEVRAGHALGPTAMLTVQEIRAQVELLAPEEGGHSMPVWNGHECHLLFGTMAVSGRLRLDRRLTPGTTAEVTIVLRAPVYVEPGMRFLLRDDNQAAIWSKGQEPCWGGTCGMGRVLATEPATR